MKRLFTLFTALSLVLFLYGQDRTITGKVLDANSEEPLPGVTVLIEGTSKGVTSDLDGNYTIDAADGQVLVFSYVGYLNESVPVSGQTTIDVNLAVDVLSLDEVIVVGYGTQKKSLVTGAIGSVSSEDISQARATRVEGALQGKSSGVLVQQSSGAPGAEQNIIIRGVGTDNSARPLYVIDGMRTEGIDWLDPEDIESLEILKDAASAAIYGVEGANGVILITTKKGVAGKTTLSYDASYGMQNVIPGFKVLDTPEYLEYYRFTRMNDRGATYDEAEAYYPDEDVNTDWLDQIYSPAPVMKHKLGVTGGNENSNYYLSIAYFDQEGVIGGDKSRFTRYSIKANLDTKATDWMTLGTRLSYSYTEKAGIDQNSVFGSVTNNAVVLDPTTPVYYDNPSEFSDLDRSNMEDGWGDDWYLNPGIRDGNGYYGISQKVLNEIQNPVQQINNDRYGDQINKFIGGIYADIKIIDGLNWRTSLDIDMSHVYNRGWNPRTYINSMNNPRPRSRAEQRIDMYYTWQFESYLSYNKVFGDHSVGAVLGTSAREYEAENLGGYGEVLMKESDNYAWISSGLNIDTLNNTSWGELIGNERSASYFGRISYSYKDKYMFTSNIRRDGNSKFGPDYKYGIFPSLSVGWVVSREDFWNVPFINFMKPRYSWGKNGNATSLDWKWAYLPQTSSGDYFYPSGTGQLQDVVEPLKLVNPEYHWEESVQTDIGIDMGFMQNRLTFTFDWYNKESTGFLMEGLVPKLAGNDPPTVNAGVIQNRGVEFELGYKNNAGELSYNLKLTASHNKSEVLKLDAGADYLLGGNVGTFGSSKRFEEGHEPWYFWGYESDGIFTSEEQILAHTNADGELLQPNAAPGDVKYIDLAGAPDSLGNPTGPDGQINDNDKTNLGSPYPKWVFGFNINLEYKGFDFNMFTYANIGNKTLLAVSVRDDISNTNKPDFYLNDAYMEGYNEGGTFPRPTVRDLNRNFSRVNEFLLQDGSFLRISNITLGYTLPKDLTSKIGISKLRVYFAVDNLYTFTKYQGMEPEVGGDYYGYQGQQWAGIDRGVYPKARTFLGGLNINF